ncbi:MAG TPA: GAF domain-containing protein, partial [Capillimicrobium sp.]|nr:GAF domain-containing protein [Capillimicrobium sp.]
MPATLERLERDIVALGDRGLDSHELRREAMERLRDGIGVDGYCFAAADPESLTMTAHATYGVDRSLAAVLYANEYGQDDVSKHRDLATSGRPTRVLSHETGGDPLRSPRMRELLQPMGAAHELRAAVSERGTTWGFIHLYRNRGRRDFSADEAALVERVSPHLAAGLRAATMRTAVS